MSKDKNTITRLIKELAKYPQLFYSAVFLTLSISGIAIVRPLIINKTLNNIQSHFDTDMLHTAGITLIVLMLVEATLQYTNSVISVILGQKLVLKTRKKLFEHITKLSIHFFDTTPVGTIVTRAVSDMEAMNEIFSDGFTTILGSIVTIIVFIITMLFINVSLSLAVLSILPILLFATWLFKNGVQKAFKEVRNAVANLNRFIQEHLSGMSIVQQFNAENTEYIKFTDLNKKHRNAHIKSIWYYSVFFPVLEILSSIAIALVIYTSFKIKNFSLGEITFFIMMTQMLFRPLRMLADQLNTLQMGLVASERVYELLDKEIIQNDFGTTMLLDVKYGITFKNVSFNYPANPNLVLKNISFFIPANSVTAIVGHTGSGKSTIAGLISRLYDISIGEILIDNIPIQNYSLKSLRESTAAVLQDSYLFNDTILNNILLFNPHITKDIVIDAAKEIGLHNYIMSLPDNYNYMPQERGATLSSGQKQMIAFLRAYVHHPKIFILDEATSMIDSHTEQILQSTLKKVLENRTAIIIAHRLSTIQMAQQIIALNDGTIIEMVTHQELMKNKDYYYHLHQAQFESEQKYA